MNKNKVISCLFLVILFNTAKAQDSNFISRKVESFQFKIQREIEKNIDVLYPDSGYLERFLFFKIDSLGKKIDTFLFVDTKGVRDSILKKSNLSNIIMYWKDMFPSGFKYNDYTFVQPVLIKKDNNLKYEIVQLPNIFLDKRASKIDYVIRFSQIVISVGEIKH